MWALWFVLLKFKFVLIWNRSVNPPHTFMIQITCFWSFLYWRINWLSTLRPHLQLGLGARRLFKQQMHGLKKDWNQDVLPGIWSGGCQFHMKNTRTRLKIKIQYSFCWSPAYCPFMAHLSLFLVLLLFFFLLIGYIDLYFIRFQEVILLLGQPSYLSKLCWCCLCSLVGVLCLVWCTNRICLNHFLLYSRLGAVVEKSRKCGAVSVYGKR